MLTIQASSPPRSTSMWRTRWCVIRFITRLTLSSGDGGRTVLHDFLHSHRPGCLAIARECMNDFTFGNETKNRVPTRHYESANILCAEPVRRSLDAGFRSYCCDVGALTLQNAFDGHRFLPSFGLAAYLSKEVVKRLDRSREHFLTSLQFRARSAGLAITDGPAAATVTPGPRAPVVLTDPITSGTKPVHASGPEIPKIFPVRLDALAPRSSGGQRYSICQLTVRDRDQHHLRPSINRTPDAVAGGSGGNHFGETLPASRSPLLNSPRATPDQI